MELDGAGGEAGGATAGLRAAQPPRIRASKKLHVAGNRSSLWCFRIDPVSEPRDFQFAASHRQIWRILGIIRTRQSHREETIATSTSLALEN